MIRSADLNPATWRDEDQQRRLGLPPRIIGDYALTLRASFDVRPLPADMTRLLERLR